MVSFLLVIGFLAAIWVLGVVLKKVVSKVPFYCSICRKGYVKAFNKLPQNTQKGILEYFKSRENRTPDTKEIYACMECKNIQDDFCHEKMSRGLENYGGYSVYCKICHQPIHMASPDRKEIKCKNCETRYKWKHFDEYGFRFLVPLTDKKILDKCNKYIDS